MVRSQMASCLLCQDRTSVQVSKCNRNISIGIWLHKEMTLEGITNLNQVWVLNRHILISNELWWILHRGKQNIFKKVLHYSANTAVTFPHQTNSTSKPIPLLSPDFLVFCLLLPIPASALCHISGYPESVCTDCLWMVPVASCGVMATSLWDKQHLRKGARTITNQCVQLPSGTKRSVVEAASHFTPQLSGGTGLP